MCREKRRASVEAGGKASWCTILGSSAKKEPVLRNPQGGEDGGESFTMPEYFNECFDESRDAESTFQRHLSEYKFSPIEDPPQLAYSILAVTGRGEKSNFGFSLDPTHTAGSI